MKPTFLMLLLFCGGVELSSQTIVQQFAAVSAGAGQVSDMDLNQPTGQGSVLIAMPEMLSPGIKVLSVTDDAPDGGNTYKQIKDASSSCENRPIEIWYCENCKAGVTELKFHLSGHVQGSINAFFEVSDMALSSVLDGNGAHISDGAANSEGQEIGPKIATTTTDFIIARYSSSSHPTGGRPADWTFKPAYAYGKQLLAGSYQPTLTVESAGGKFCMSVAAFKTATPPPAPKASR